MLDRAEALFELLESRVYQKEKAWVFAHNYNFDALILSLFTQLSSNGYELKRWVIDSDMFIVIARKAEKTLCFIDSFNYFKVSIAKMGEILGYEKLSVDFKKVSDEELMTYCLRDAEILMKFMESFILFWHENNYGNFRYTLASLSLEAYRHKFMDYDIWLHEDEQAQLLEMDSYRGGRTEAFFIGRPPSDMFYKLDINSQYPAVMSSNDYPVALVDVKDNVDPRELKELLAKYLAVASVDFYARDNCLAVRRERLLFPKGKITATLCTPELRYLQIHGRIERIRQIALYRHAPIFTRYIEDFYSKRLAFRQAGNTILDSYTRVLMNSLYGKFGQQNQDYECIGLSWLDHNCIQTVLGDDKSLRRTEVHLNGKVYVVKGKEIAHHAFIAIASHVTAYARMLLWRYIRQSGDRNCFYTDTDSLVVNKEGYDNLAEHIDPLVLGKLKLEGKSSNFIIRNVKDYTFETDVKRKGIRKDAEQIDEFTFKQLRFSKIRSMLHEAHDNFVIVAQTEKHLSAEYKKGDIGADKWVTPFVFSDF